MSFFYNPVYSCVLWGVECLCRVQYVTYNLLMNSRHFIRCTLSANRSVKRKKIRKLTNTNFHTNDEKWYNKSITVLTYTFQSSFIQRVMEKNTGVLIVIGFSVVVDNCSGSFVWGWNARVNMRSAQYAATEKTAGIDFVSCLHHGVLSKLVSDSTPAHSKPRLLLRTMCLLLFYPRGISRRRGGGARLLCRINWFVPLRVGLTPVVCPVRGGWLRRFADSVIAATASTLDTMSSNKEWTNLHCGRELSEQILVYM